MHLNCANAFPFTHLPIHQRKWCNHNEMLYESCYNARCLRWCARTWKSGYSMSFKRFSAACRHMLGLLWIVTARPRHNETSILMMASGGSIQTYNEQVAAHNDDSFKIHTVPVARALCIHFAKGMMSVESGGFEGNETDMFFWNAKLSTG